MTVIICDGGPSVWFRKVIYCPTCMQRRRFVCRFQAWYGVDKTCLSCGDRWSDGELRPRPWRRGWRKESIAYARERWATASPHREAHRRMRRVIEESFA
jgi:hypothetical protein